MRRRPFVLSTIDVFDIIGERHNNQLPHVFVKDYASHECHLGKSVNGTGEIFFVGNIILNDMDRQENLCERAPEYFNNIMYPGMWRNWK
ncbi:predicted ORF [Xanthomonas phage XacN1]|nr:predicted ORF [Xanthomonas phage XacN1]